MNISDLLASLASGRGLNITPGNPAMDITQLVSQVGQGNAPQAPMPMAPVINQPQPAALPGAPVGAMNLNDPPQSNDAQTGGYMSLGAGLQGNIPRIPQPPPETELTAPKGTSPMMTGSIAPPAAPASSALGAPQQTAPDFSPSFGQGLINVGNALQGKGVEDLNQQALAKNQTYKALITRGLDPESAEAAVRNPEILKSVLPSLFNPLISLDAQSKKNEIAMQPLKEQLIKAQIANAGTKPSFTTIGHDAFGQPTYGFVDARTGIVTPVSNPQPAAEAAPPGMQGVPTGEEYLKTLPKPIGDQIKAIAEGRMPIPSGFALKTPYWQQMMTHVSQYDPSFDAVNYNSRAKTRNDFTSGKSAQNITSFNTAIGHLGELDEAINGLGNSDFVPVNVANNATSGVNAKRAAALAKFNTARNAVVEELTRAFKGTGGSLTEVQNWEKLIDPNASPAALNEAVKTAVNLLESRIDSVGEQYNKGMGLMSDPIKLLSPKAQKIWQSLNGSESQSAAPATPSIAPSIQASTPTSKAEYDALPSGTPFIDPNGQQRVKP